MRRLMERLLLLCVPQAFIVVHRVQRAGRIVSTLLSFGFQRRLQPQAFDHAGDVILTWITYLSHKLS
jgi:hypothetical protein